MKINPDSEKILKQQLAKNFDGGRKNWNYSHTLSAVYWMRYLIKREGGNEKILATAMYLHDLGYGNLIKKKYTLSQRLKAKKMHMKIGAQIAKKVCRNLGYSYAEIKKISHLVGIHDNLKRLKTKEEFMVMEADSLALLNYGRAPTNLSKKDYQKFIRGFPKSRLVRFRTRTGKNMVAKLFKSAKKYSKGLS